MGTTTDEVLIEDALDLDDATIGEAFSAGDTGEEAKIPEDLRIFGPGSVAWMLLGCMSIELAQEKIKHAVNLRSKIVSGRHEALDAEDIKLMCETISKPHPSEMAEGQSIVTVMIKRDTSPMNRWGWTVLADYLDYRNRLIGQDPADLEEFEYQHVIDRGPMDLALPPESKYAVESPPSNEIHIWGKKSPLLTIVKYCPPTGEAKLVKRVGVLQDAIERGDWGVLTRDDWKYFKEAMKLSAKKLGFIIHAQCDDLWDWLAVTRTVSARYSSALETARLKRDPRKKKKKKR